ncbi:MAG TPA: hypothetical protein VIY68_14050 [Steroidobacteraceae bacterium]
MPFIPVGRASAIAAVGLLLAACGGSSQSAAIPTAASSVRQIGQHGKSWMLREAKSDNLLYLTFGCGGSCIVSYPTGKLVGTLSGVGDGAPCVDSIGNVYIPQQSQLQEYAHGGITPIATFNAGGFIGGCSVDATTGSVAVVYVNNGPTVAVFPKGKCQSRYLLG